MREYYDTIFISLPRAAEVVVAGDTLYVREMAALVQRLSAMARDSLVSQYPYSTMVAVEWQFFIDEDSARAMELPHECADCQEGKDRSIIMLRDDPNHIVAFGTMHCMEPDSVIR